MHPDGYFALVLDAASQHILRREYATLRHVIAHHCTVRYGSDRLSDLPPPFVPTDLGRMFQLRVIGVARALRLQPFDLLNYDTQLDDLGYLIEMMRRDPKVLRLVRRRIKCVQSVLHRNGRSQGID